MKNIYCGNNSQYPDLLSGKVELGTKYTCMRKGVGMGSNMPLDYRYLGPYSPLDERKIYCGVSPLLPPAYDLDGNLPQCLQKGIGVGKRIRALRGPTPDWGLRIILWIALIGVIGGYLVFRRPLFLMKETEGDQVPEWDFRKIALWAGPLLVGWTIFLIFF